MSPTHILRVGKVDPDGPTSKPLSIHVGDSLLRVCPIPKRQKSVPPTLPTVHVPHDPRVTQTPKGNKGLLQYFVRHFGREVTDEQVRMVRQVFLRCRVLDGPVATDLLVEDLAPVERLQRRLG
jgi:hypothetical protein